MNSILCYGAPKSLVDYRVKTFLCHNEVPLFWLFWRTLSPWSSDIIHKRVLYSVARQKKKWFSTSAWMGANFYLSYGLWTKYLSGIRNTHLLRTYAQVDSRVRPMVIAVKKWAGSRDINDASCGTLSSYSLVLMIIHYLQCGANPPVLKSLQVDCSFKSLSILINK